MSQTYKEAIAKAAQTADLLTQDLVEAHKAICDEMTSNPLAFAAADCLLARIRAARELADSLSNLS